VQYFGCLNSFFQKPQNKDMSKDSTKKVIKNTALVLTAAYAVLDVIAKVKKPDSVYENEPEQKNPMEGKKTVFVESSDDSENADGKRGHLEGVGPSNARLRKKNVYEKYLKRALDKSLSFVGLVALSPVMLGISTAIKMEDPGPVLFTQKRVGEDKQYFKLHKFRSMKMSTPHDVPTHMLENPDSYITKVGGFIRKHSLDELPQIWDIFIGNMSIVGPRPALWNQDVLTAERDKYGANDIKPGLTGWAQINGRDELEIPDKAKLDGEYTRALEGTAKEAAAMDKKCFLGSVGVFAKDDSVVEGGTGELNREEQNHLREDVPLEDPEEHFGCDYSFHVNHSSHKNVLVIGAGSYIGETFVSYAKNHYPDNFDFTVVSTLPDEDGRSELDKLSDESFSMFDIVYHLAGIAHADVGNVSDEVKEKYYKVNTDLAIRTAKRYKSLKKDGVFVFMSSMIVYGDSAPYGKDKTVTRNTIPEPANFYGDSKWQADKGIRALADGQFKTYVLRPPMIYGRGSKGNYPLLAKLAKKLPVFPDVDNQRSMLYVENLCEFLCQLFLTDNYSDLPDSLIFMPQNPEYTKTSDLVREIAITNGKRSVELKLFNPSLRAISLMPGKVGKLVNKAFGNSKYEKELSIYDGIKYQIYDLRESVIKAEG
jgi:lipopolysaccharide/colanic/teichoic acid biosynthesis glycosyltransferase/nucleoside-diphosphate-sugar epimerase